MIVDSSALLAVALGEPDGAVYVDALDQAESPRIGAATLLEAGIVAARRMDPRVSRRLDALVSTSRAVVVPFDEEQARVARAAYRDFGKGSGHKAQLNFGDCLAYALASVTGEPLLYKGDDFAHTDIRSALD
ncbi:type II toxin-antitoxin system VapC family toxin [Nocardioides speluncae]|uniref:type II toxin-antitoxin system VapC family toxin n=1 Tax=Nocardioides speluncae TaxID=2670337 RepID=UPI000D697F87|nr:type II toxin-antitoxin system VapC family toxin [Nocardioides speluncae]